MNNRSVFRKRKTSTRKKKQLLRNKSRIYCRSKGTVKKRISKRTRTRKGGSDKTDASPQVKTINVLDNENIQSYVLNNIPADSSWEEVENSLRQRIGKDVRFTYFEDDDDEIPTTLEDEYDWKDVKRKYNNSNTINLQVHSNIPRSKLATIPEEATYAPPFTVQVAAPPANRSRGPILPQITPVQQTPSLVANRSDQSSAPPSINAFQTDDLLKQINNALDKNKHLNLHDQQAIKNIIMQSFNTDRDDQYNPYY